MFWVAGDDHDLDEIDHAYFQKADGAPVRLKACLIPAGTAYAASDVQLAGTMSVDGDGLASLLSMDKEKSLFNEYSKRSFESAFAALMLRWLGKFGLVVAQSSSLRPLAVRLLQRNLNDYAKVETMIASAAQRLTAHGFKPGFEAT